MTTQSSPAAHPRARRQAAPRTRSHGAEYLWICGVLLALALAAGAGWAGGRAFAPTPEESVAASQLELLEIMARYDQIPRVGSWYRIREPRTERFSLLPTHHEEDFVLNHFTDGWGATFALATYVEVRPDAPLFTVAVRTTPTRRFSDSVDAGVPYALLATPMEYVIEAKPGCRQIDAPGPDGKTYAFGWARVTSALHLQYINSADPRDAYSLYEYADRVRRERIRDAREEYEASNE